MKKLITLIIVIVVLIAIGWLVYRKQTVPAGQTATTTPEAIKEGTAQALPKIGSPASGDEIVVTAPRLGATVANPLEVSGKARGPWFFEASAPVVIIDTNGEILGQGKIEATGDWMTGNFVPFKGTIAFSTTTPAGAGAVVFLNDNPSGEASTSRYMVVPVFFAP